MQAESRIRRLRRAVFIAGGVAVVFVGGYVSGHRNVSTLKTVEVPSAGWTAMEPSQPFSQHSFWNEPIASSLRVPADSAGLVRQLVHQISTHYGTVNINTTAYSAPVYVVGPATRRVRVALRRCDAFAPAGVVEAALASVPLPQTATAAAGSDADLIVWQPSSDSEWELWRAERTAAGWSACSGGEFVPVSSATGVFPAPEGVAASGLSVLGGLIRFSDLRSGSIDHVLSVGIPDTKRYPSYLAPADRTDGASTAEDAIPEGTRFRLDPTVDVSKLGLTPIGEMIATALQRYGMIVSDTSGGVSFQAQDPTPVTATGGLDPWTLAFGDLPSYEVLSRIPWTRLEVVPPDSAT